jgi:hypothetical protein
MPNLSYPTNQNIGFRVGDELITIMPPPLAWGDSAPWAYKDEPALAYRAALGEYTELLFSAYMRANAEIINRLAEHPLPVDEKYAMDHPTWQDQFLGLTKAVLIALFLEQSVSPLEAKSYVQYMQRIEHLSMLPGAMGIFKRYLDEYHAGQIGSFSEYLPNISKYLRVTKSIGAL